MTKKGKEDMDKIDRIITKTIRRQLLNEHSSSRHFEKQIDMISCNFMQLKYIADKTGNYKILQKLYPIQISLKPFFNENDNIPKEYLQERTFLIKINYNHENEGIQVTGRYKPNELNKATNQITLNVPKYARYHDLASAIHHEVTHLVDDLIRICTNYKTYYYSDKKMTDFKLPKFARVILYTLWSNTELNAWTNNHKYIFKNMTWTDYIMKYLKEANNTNDEEQWDRIKIYVAFIMDRRKFLYKKPLDFKKYFINTSFNKLKKMVKKYY